jgi:hypothetical protein
MREIEPKFELFDNARVGAGNWIVGDAAGTGIAGLGETGGTSQEFKNTGNKARMLLKAKHITFLKGAIPAFLAFELAQIRRLKGAKAGRFTQDEAKTSESRGKAER